MARSKKAQAAIDDALSISQAQSSVGLGVDLVEVDRMERNASIATARSGPLCTMQPASLLKKPW